jgi:hypothetical protein
MFKLKFYSIIVLIAIIISSCDKEDFSSNGFLIINVNNGPTLSAKFVNSPLPSRENEFSFQATNRAMIFALFENNSEAYLDIWPSDLDANNVKTNKKYSSLGNWERGQDDFELLIYMNGAEVSFDNSEITFSKYSLPGEIKGEFKATNKGMQVINGSFNFSMK